MIPVYLESPFLGEVQRNKAYLQLCILDCLLRGESPFASHQMFTDALFDFIREQRVKGITAGNVWRRFARRTVVYTDFGISEGMAAGIASSAKLEMPVEYRVLPNFIPAIFFSDFDRETEVSWEKLLSRQLMVIPRD